MTSVAEHLVAAVRRCAHAYVAGDQVAPSAVLWPDPERLWESVVADLLPHMPELFVLGDYAPAKRTGPALWLRCIEARLVEGAPPVETTPIFYLPGVSREILKVAEDCPKELMALVELQYRGIIWLDGNGKEWTPHGFLVSKHGGLGFEVGKDRATHEALAGAFPALMAEPVSQLRSRRLESDFFNALVAPDAPGLLLRWLNDPEAFKQRRKDAEWKAFCEQCKADFRFDPVKEGPLRAAGLLANRDNSWGVVWRRFAESSVNYPGVLEWLRRAAPKVETMFDSAEVWPTINEREEQELRQAFESLTDRPRDEVIGRIVELESQHSRRRSYPWKKLGLSPFATALEPLAQLATLCRTAQGAETPQDYAEFYARSGWQADAAAVTAMAACESLEQHRAVLGVLRAVYLPWLEGTARHLQHLVQLSGESVSKRFKPIAATPGRAVLFADGLRMDVARRLANKLATEALQSTVDWEWSTIPSVTATAKPAASPIASNVQGGEKGEMFSTQLVSTGQPLTQDRFITALKAEGWQFLGPGETGDPSGSAWTESGALDKRGHAEGWKLARSVDREVNDLVSRVGALLKAGWAEVIVVTDHGWLLVPGGLPKVELKSFLAENRWGRCAVLKVDAQAEIQTFKWQWNPSVSIASPPGAGCYRASMEYSHGGISLQEMVTPVVRVTAVERDSSSARLLEAKWTGAKCRVMIEGHCAAARVDVRTVQADSTTSLLSDRLAREVTPEGKVTVFLEEDSDIGKEAHIVLLDASGQVVDVLSKKVGE